jgi:hypothetical protein
VVDHQTAKALITDKHYFANPNWNQQQGRAVRQGCHPDILEFERTFIKKLRTNGIPMFCHTAMRSNAEQQRLYEEGHSQIKQAGAHQAGCAVDIIPSVQPWDMDKRCWSIVGHLGHEHAAAKGIDIRWGGDWSFYDPAHWELANWRELAGKF